MQPPGDRGLRGDRNHDVYVCILLYTTIYPSDQRQSMTQSSVISYRAGEKLEVQIEERAGGIRNTHGTAREMAERYAYCMEKALDGVDLTEKEAHLIVDSFNGTIFEPLDMVARYGLEAGLEDTSDVVYTKWEVDRESLLDKIKSFSIPERLAVIDAIERYWAGVSKGWAVSVRSVGLVSEHEL